jgi:outer membrane lipopolysaccharide assembly protein LptE/RlpB
MLKSAMIKTAPFSKESNFVTQNIHFSHIRLTLILLIASVLSGCGFHFRGDYLVPDEVSKMSVTSFDDFDQFTRNVKTELRQNGIELVDPSPDVSNLHLVSESIGERTLSIYQNSRAAEKSLTLNANYRVTVPDIGIKTFSTQVNRSYLDNPLTALAKSVERDMIEGEMREQAARQIIRQLARLRADIQANKIKLESELNGGNTSELDVNVEVNEPEVLVEPAQSFNDQVTTDQSQG